MPNDPPDVDKLALRQRLSEDFGFEPATLTYIPEGEECYGFLAETAVGQRCFVKLHRELRPDDLGLRYEAVQRLVECGLDFVVGPRPTRSGAFLSDFGKYAIALFNFIEGPSRDVDRLTEADWSAMAQLAAALHADLEYPSLPSLPQSRPQVDFKDWLLRVVAAAEDPQRQPTNDAQRQTRDLLRREKADILATLTHLETVAEQANAHTDRLCLTHGDLKPLNFIADRRGKLHLIDWTKIALSFPERDLVNFVGQPFETFLNSYLAAFQQPPQLHPEIFEFYIYYLIVGGIADYGSWILLEEASPEETAYAWDKLKAHLPINQQQVHGHMETVRRTIKGTKC